MPPSGRTANPTPSVAKESRVPDSGSVVGEERGAEVQSCGGAVADEVVGLDGGPDTGADRDLAACGVPWHCLRSAVRLRAHRRGSNHGPAFVASQSIVWRQHLGGDTVNSQQWVGCNYEGAAVNCQQLTEICRMRSFWRGQAMRCRMSTAVGRRRWSRRSTMWSVRWPRARSASPFATASTRML